jgi:hypothetical protein
MKTKYLILNLMIVCFVCSCENTEKEGAKNHNSNYYIIDSLSNSFDLRDFYPPLDFNNSDVDFNYDTQKDFSFLIQDLWSDSYQQCLDWCAQDTISETCDCIETFEYELYFTSNQSIDVCFSDSSSSFPKAFNQKDTVYFKNIWLNKEKYLIAHQQPGNSYTDLYNRKVNFVCFRYKTENDTIYGWINLWIDLNNRYSVNSIGFKNMQE